MLEPGPEPPSGMVLILCWGGTNSAAAWYKGLTPMGKGPCSQAHPAPSLGLGTPSAAWELRNKASNQEQGLLSKAWRPTLPLPQA